MKKKSVTTCILKTSSPIAENDINEKNDLSEQFPEITKKLNILLEEYLKDVKAPKWKKGINWRPFKKTLKEFNSFY